MKKNAKLYDVRKISDLRDMLEQSTKIYGDKALFKVKREQGGKYENISFKKYYVDVNAFGTMLVELGTVGEKIAIIGKTCYAWYVTYMATVNGVGVIVPIDKEQPINEMKNMIERAEASVIVFDNDHKEAALQLAKELPFVKILIGMDEENHEGNIYSFDKLLKTGKIALEEGNDAYRKLPIDAKAMNILLFTSGTTANAKAVMLSHENICMNLMAMCTMLYIGPEDTFLSVLPIHHTYECTCGFLCQLYRGSTVAVCEGLRYIVKNMGEASPTIVLMVPLMVESIHKKIFSKENRDKVRKGIKISNALRKIGIDARKKIFKQVHDLFGGQLKLVISGGAAIDPKIIKDLRDLGIQCVQGYGLTECAPILALNRDVFYNDAAAGLPLPGVDVQVVDKDENGIGEIIGKGANVMIGYYKDEQATAEAIVDGYYHTGDLGYMDKDGFIIITGRKKNVIVTKNGKNVFPEEIEYLLNKSDYIVECVVKGRKGDDGSGENVDIIAEVFPDKAELEAALGKDYTAQQALDLIKQVVKEVNQQLATYKYVKDVFIRDEEFEKTTSKKIRRNTN